MRKNVNNACSCNKGFITAIFVLSTSLSSSLYVSCGNPTGPSPQETHLATSADITFTSVSVSSESITVSWNALSGSFTDSLVLTCAQGSDETAEEREKTATSHTFSGLDANSAYTLGLRAESEDDSVLFHFAIDLTTAENGAETIAYAPVNSAGDLAGLIDMEDSYLLMFDISLSEYPSWTPLGTQTERFSGLFNGAGKTISDLNIESSDDTQGLFWANDGEIENLAIVDCSVSGASGVGSIAGTNYGEIRECSTSGTISGSMHCGGLVGTNLGTITDCRNSADVISTSRGSSLTGGLVGSNIGTITGCSNAGSVEGNATAGGLVGDDHGNITRCRNSAAVSCNTHNAGGLVGNKVGGTISECHNAGTISGDSAVGGLIGRHLFGSVDRCYNTGTILGEGTVPDRIGGLIGLIFDTSNDSTIGECYNAGRVSGYSNVGGLVGENQEEDAIISSCYFDTETSGQTNPVGSDATITDGSLTSEEMKNSANYTGWDFLGDGNGVEDIWSIDASGAVNGGYPYLTSNPPEE